MLWPCLRSPWHPSMVVDEQNEDWNAEPKEWKTGILVVSAIMYITSLVALILLFIYFGNSFCVSFSFCVVI
jgi:hypothetical protein